MSQFAITVESVLKGYSISHKTVVSPPPKKKKKKKKKKVAFADKFICIEMLDPLSGIRGLSRQVVFHDWPS